MTGWWFFSNIFVHFHPENWGFMIPNFDEHIFQMGWFNHQPDDFEAGDSNIIVNTIPYSLP